MKGYSAFPKAPASLETSRSDCLVSYLGHSLVLPLCREAVGVFYSACLLCKEEKGRNSSDVYRFNKDIGYNRVSKTKGKRQKKKKEIKEKTVYSMGVLSVKMSLKHFSQN